MKKILFSLLLSTSLVIAAHAQFGVNAGLNISRFHGDDIHDNFKSKVGFHFGAFYQIPVSNGISVQPEVAYSAEGAKVSGDGSSGSYNLGSLNLAALFRYNFQGGFNLATGPQYGILLSAKEKEDGDSYDAKDSFKGGNFAWAFTAGYDLPTGLGFYARYNLGLANIVDESDVDVKSSTIQIGLRYNISSIAGKK